MDTGVLVTNIQSRAGLLSGTGPVPQILITIAVILIIYLALASIEVLYSYINRMNLYRTDLLPITYATDNKSITIPQNPNDPNAKLVALSDNERSGPEYSYSFFLFVNPSTFRQEEGLLHIFHKGNPNQYPLLNPGVYMHSNTNTLRVYMNTYKTWDSFIDIDNFPVGKWVYVTIVCRSTHGEVYVNGNLAKKIRFDGYQPYLNYSNIICFSQRRISRPASYSVDTNNKFNVFGAMQGFVSRLTYFSYGLSYTEINSLMNQGPSKKIDETNMVKPPYLDDKWWVSGAS
jgi:hypothetical protein